LARLLDIPAVTTEHTLWHPWLDKNPSVRRQVREVLPHIQIVSVVSKTVEQSVLRFLEDGSKIETLPNVVDSAFRLRASDEPWNPDQLLFVGVVRKVKGLDVLVRALARLVDDRPQLRLRVIGEPFYKGYRRDEEEVRGLIADLGLKERIEFSGYAAPEAVARAMRGSALLVVPSRRESFSAVTMEAIASGTPVVATSCGGPEEIVSQDTGRIVPVEDDVALAMAIEEVLEARSSFDGERMRAEIMLRFGTDQVAARIHGIYTRARNMFSEQSPQQ
jgi:glycosyltransferase involved in cell wall biosynthesis